jgi:endonuclease YncB( thermonuclease family)
MNLNSSRLISLIVVMSLPLLPVLVQAQQTDFTAAQTYEVAAVIDGDTVKLVIDGKPTTVRLIGIDTPETVHPTKPVEPYGKRANEFLHNLVNGGSVYLEYGSARTDKNGRLLAYLYRAPDGLFVNLEIVRQGYGGAYSRYPFKYSDLFVRWDSLAAVRSRAFGNSPDHRTKVVVQGRPLPHGHPRRWASPKAARASLSTSPGPEASTTWIIVATFPRVRGPST